MKSKAAQRRKNKKKKLPPFASIEIKTIDSDAWAMLNKIEVLIFIILKTFYRGDSRPFKAPFDLIKKRSRIKHGDTITKAIKSLEDKYWIKVKRFAKHGKAKSGLRVKPNEYTLTFAYDFKRY